MSIEIWADDVRHTDRTVGEVLYEIKDELLAIQAELKALKESVEAAKLARVMEALDAEI